MTHRELPKTTATRQFADLVLAPVDPDKLETLRSLLARVRVETIALMQGHAQPDALVPFHEIASLHYARFVLLEDGGVERTLLAFATDYDGPEGQDDCGRAVAHERHVDQLVQQAGGGLASIFQCCKGYRPGELGSYLERHQRSSSTFYVGASGRSRQQILWEAALRRDVDALLDAQDLRAEPPDVVRQRVLDGLRTSYPRGIPSFPAQPDLTGKVTRVSMLLGFAALCLVALASFALWRVWPLGHPLWLQAISAVAVVLGSLLLLAGALVLRFRWLEQTDPQFQPSYSEQTRLRLEHASRDENIFLQNQLTHVVCIKPGLLRWLLIRLVFSALQLLATNTYNRGKLGNIPSIHFARWVLGPGRKVIFFSNFDSSWQSYLGDFIDQASGGLTAVWSNTIGYPRTTWLLRAGSRDAARFLAWTRHHQLPSQVWYSAYPGLSIVNVNSNTEIRRGLADQQAVDPVSWLSRLRNIDRLDADQRFGELQTREPPLRMDDIQGIILKGFGHMPEARYLLLRVKQEGPALRRWLSELPITSAAAGSREEEPPDPLINLAFSYEGLLAIGVERALCERFSTAFVQGSHHPYRARVNGDVGEDAPQRWRWGADHAPVHVVLLVYAKDKPRLAGFVAQYCAAAEAVGLELVESLEGTTLPGRKEHFGFRDGIAQPVVQGSGRAERPGNTVAAGEVLLGHKDGYGNRSHSPMSSEGFAFGFNGSYLVLRQLEQDVESFWRYCASKSVEGAAGAIELASKMVGRWPSGAPLVRHPARDPQQTRFEDEDDFRYLAPGEDNDRYGSRCPFGAHIRRTNPRDWELGADAEESTTLSNLHRIVRRGRPYGPPLSASMQAAQLIDAASSARSEPAEAPRGLSFLCLNTNIDRQFEFIQQQWCNNPKFAGQNSDADPLLGLRQPAAELGIDAAAFTVQSDVRTGLCPRAMLGSPAQGPASPQLARFVRVVGSGYFFMPSLSAIRLLADHLHQPVAPLAMEVCPPDEQLHIDNLIGNLRSKLQADYTGKQTLRDAHPKMHGCLRATLQIADDVPPHLRHGLFACPTSYRAWLRFSNANTRPSSDHQPDLRGLALKLLNVPGPKLLDGEESSPTHDLVFVSHPHFVTRDVAGFSQLAAALAKSQLTGYFVRHPRVLVRYLRGMKRQSSLLETEFFSMVPYLLGKAAVKYTLRPVASERSAIPSRPSPDYLRTTMQRQLAERGYSFELLVQEYRDDRSTPIEDPTRAWQSGKLPLARIATLHIPAQHFDSAAQRAFGENLSFNPWRCLPEHRPLGGINRARRQVYRALSAFRHARNAERQEEPTE